MQDVAALLRSTVRHICESVAFLSILPVQSNEGEPDFARSAYTFPIAGLVIGILPAASYFVAARWGLPPLACAALCVLLLIVITRGLHEDGLADVADGFWGGHTRERKLTIMRDSTIGTFGALALIATVLVRTIFLAEIGSRLSDAATALTILIVAALSRAAILYPWTVLPSARSGTDMGEAKPAASLAARYGAPTRYVFGIAAILTIPLILALALTAGFAATCVALVAATAVTLALNRLSLFHIGGRTGDTLGATQQLCEWGLYVGLAMAI